MSNHNFCHIEISAKDAKATAEFYHNLFGWELSFDMGDEYIFFKTESGLGGAFSKETGKTIGNNIINYIYVDDITSTLDKAKSLGGGIVKEKTDIPGHGWYGHGKDIDGNIFGLFTSRE